MVTFTGSHNLVRNHATKCMRSMPHPKLTNIVWGAGLSFAKCHAERKVPYDPHIPHIFDGEEFSRGLRYVCDSHMLELICLHEMCYIYIYI